MRPLYLPCTQPQADPLSVPKVLDNAFRPVAQGLGIELMPHALPFFPMGSNVIWSQKPYLGWSTCAFFLSKKIYLLFLLSFFSTILRYGLLQLSAIKTFSAIFQHDCFVWVSSPRVSSQKTILLLHTLCHGNLLTCTVEQVPPPPFSNSGSNPPNSSPTLPLPNSHFGSNGPTIRLQICRFAICTTFTCPRTTNLISDGVSSSSANMNSSKKTILPSFPFAQALRTPYLQPTTSGLFASRAIQVLVGHH